jgi:hypothetical protein
MTRDQERARELIATIEGTNLTVCEEDHLLTLTSETGQVYTVDREGRWSCNNGRRGDTTALEMEADDPLWSRPNPLDDPYDRPADDELYEDIYRREEAKPLSDFHSDRDAELRAEEQRWRDDVAYYRGREAA